MGNRISESAIQRNRERIRERRKEKQELRSFVFWDSEGYDAFQVDSNGVCEKLPQRTMLFGCAFGPDKHEYITGIDLSSKEMFDLLLRVEAQYPDVHHVGFAFEYDINQMLKDLPWRMLAVLKITGKVRWHGYRIAHIPHKTITVSRDGITARIDDGFGFFHSKYLHALKRYGVGNEDTWSIIKRGKNHRGHFSYAELPEVTAYWKAETGLGPELFGHVRDAAYGGGFYIRSWHGPGALATFGLHYNGVHNWHSKKRPSYVNVAIRLAYAGGRFQSWRCGWYEGDVYTLDKNSAYVQAISELPRLDNGKWERVNPKNIKGPGDIARFGLYHISFGDRNRERSARLRNLGIPERPYPLFHRDKNGRLTWPDNVDGWYWSPEARLLAGDQHAQFHEAIAFRDDGSFPFRWVNDSYETRLRLQQMGNPAEMAYKWALAAMYGAFARLVGWNRRLRTAPKSHELAWAGYITSHCRAAIFEVASYAASKGGLISVDTDGVMATCQFPESLVSEGFGTGLGQWKQDHYVELLYWQNGIYWLRDTTGEWKEAKSRGVPKGSISLEDAQSAIQDGSFHYPYQPPKICTSKTRYVGYRQALAGQFKRWRVWITEPYEIIFGGTGKGTHLPPFCRACRTGDGMHTITHLPPRDPISVEHKLPWLADPVDTSIGELGSDIFGLADEIIKVGDYEDRL